MNVQELIWTLSVLSPVQQLLHNTQMGEEHFRSLNKYVYNQAFKNTYFSLLVNSITKALKNTQCFSFLYSNLCLQAWCQPQKIFAVTVSQGQLLSLKEVKSDQSNSSLLRVISPLNGC